MAQLTTQQSFNVALQRHQSGRLREAEALYRQILTQQPAHVGALHYLGVLEHQQGRNELAIDMIGRAIALNPNAPEAHNNLGLALKANGQVDEAIAAYRQALALKSNYASALYNLGFALQSKEQLDEAIAAYQHAIALRPNYVEAHSSLGDALREKGRLDEAIAAFRQAVALGPDRPDAHNNLGVALKDKGQFEEAVAAYRRAIALRPDYAEAHSNLGNALRSTRKLDEAIAAHRQAVALKPAFSEAHFNLADALLARGDFLAAWPEHEWRWQCRDFPSPLRNFTQPRWDGSPLAGRTLLVHTEQGFGDSLQFIRYVPLLANHGGKIIVECQPELERLFHTVPGGFQVVVRDQPLPAFDVHCPVGSLPMVFKTTLATIPADVPYLFPDQQLLESWRQKLADSATGLKIGLAWAGNPAFKGDRTRSLTLDRLAALTNVPGVTFYSLQKGDAQRQVERAPARINLINLAPKLRDFADTAAVMCLMDLIITTDTSVAHLAGALGRPVWLMLQFVPDWRWLSDRADNPWYPSMRLFRQQERGDWDSVIEEVAKALADQAGVLKRG